MLLRVNSSWIPVETCHTNFTVGSSSGLLLDEKNCSVPIPPAWRRRGQQQQQQPNSDAVPQAKFRFQFSNGTAVLDVPVQLIRRIEQQRSTAERRNLLSAAANDNNNPSADAAAASSVLEGNVTWVPYLRYGRAPIRIRFVADFRPYGKDLLRQDGVRLLSAVRSALYRPMIYIDDNSLPTSAQVELAADDDDDDRPPVALRLKVTAVSPTVDALNRVLLDGLEMAESFLAGSELDEIRYFLQDEKLYRLACSQTISSIHIWLDYLAFRDEVRFYRGRTNLTGVSSSTVISQLICSVIIFLYLMDGGGTSWVVLFSLASSIMVEAWKVWKILQPRWSPSWPFVSVRELRTSKEQDAAEYDRLAASKLGMVLYPVVGVWSLYALYHYTYKSWWSWFIGNLANAVYTFGFIAMCPQLYVNYRLKSVAHLPWKVFLYKIFTTFVDDVFAFLVEMPLKHRLMTLRDDVVFLVLLYQAYVYRVDKTRTNEYGYAYEDDKDGNSQGMSKKEKAE